MAVRRYKPRVHRRRRTNPARPRYRHRRRNPSRSNPGFTGIIMSGLWIGAGMWLGGLVNGLIGGLLGGLTSSLGAFGGIASGLVTAYAVAWIGNRFIGHGELMGAGAFASTAIGAIGGLLGGAGSLVSSLTGSLTGGGGNAPQQPVATPSQQLGPASSNVIAMTGTGGH